LRNQIERGDIVKDNHFVNAPELLQYCHAMSLVDDRPAVSFDAGNAGVTVDPDNELVS
jgi:hypothetical protein